MDPTYRAEHFSEPGAPLWRRAWEALKPAWRIARIALRLLVWNPLVRHRDGQFRNEDGTVWQRLSRGICYRIAFVPVMVALVVAMVVWGATHPQYAVATTDPNSKGVYYETVTFKPEGAPSIEAWLVPQVDARKVLSEGEKSIRQKHAAVILVPDCGQGADQVLPLIQPLHEAGLVVMAINAPRTSVVRSRGITFGLRESVELQAAIAVLKKRSSVDPKRIALVGIGGGANAVMLAAKRDPGVRAIVVDRPLTGTDDLRDCLGPTRSGFQWMQPLCKWGFELSYQVDAEELELKNYGDLLKKPGVLLFSRSDPGYLHVLEQKNEVVAFLLEHLKK